jgi:hypothetical protein
MVACTHVLRITCATKALLATGLDGFSCLLLLMISEFVAMM